MLKKTKFKYQFLLLMGVFPLTTPVYALNVNVIRSVVEGKVAQVNQSVQKVDRSLIQSAQQAHQDSQIFVKAVEALLDAKNRSDRDLMVQRGAAQARVQAEREFGAHAAPINECDMDLVSAAISKAKGSRTNVDTVMRNYLSAHRDLKDKATYLSKKANIAPNDPSMLAGNLGIESGTFKNKKAAALFLQQLVEPNPPVIPNKKELKKQGGKKLQVAIQDRNRRMSLADELAILIQKDGHPTMDLGQLATRLYTEMGGEGKPPYLNDQNEMSLNSLYQMLIEYRITPAYLTKMAQANEVAIAREQYSLNLILAQMQIQREKRHRLFDLFELDRYSTQVRQNHDLGTSMRTSKKTDISTFSGKSGQ